MKTTSYAYFGRTKNVKDAPAALSPALVGNILSALAPKEVAFRNADVIDIASARGAK